MTDWARRTHEIGRSLSDRDEVMLAWFSMGCEWAPPLVPDRAVSLYAWLAREFRAVPVRCCGVQIASGKLSEILNFEWCYDTKLDGVAARRSSTRGEFRELG